jgi:rfaE bifunctional protein kinase chain/domain
MFDLNSARAAEIIDKCRRNKIAVIGDVMLDRYFWGSVTRISPESPVPVVDLEDETYHLGGAANVANNLNYLGIEPLLCGLIGDDNSGSVFSRIANESGINTEGLYRDAGRPTIVKTRIIGNNQQIARLDRETRDQIGQAGEDYIISFLKSHKSLSGIIFEDYNKGVISRTLIQRVMEEFRDNGVPVFVDPKFDNFFEYKNVTVFKPNRKEARQALGVQVKTREDIIEAGKRLLNELKCSNVLLTLGKDGMMLFESNGTISEVATKARHVADVSGAGDTAIATLAAAYSGGANIREAATLANYASGAVCELPGIVAITKEMLIETIHNDK